MEPSEPDDNRKLPGVGEPVAGDGTWGVPAPPHQQARYLLAVGVGGAVGVTARYLITEVGAPLIGQPVTTLVINVVGCLLLGVLLEALACRGPDVGGRRMIRLLVGTGGLGGFTTYSTLALDAGSYLQAGRPLIMIGYGLGSVLAGALAAAAGIILALRLHRFRERRS